MKKIIIFTFLLVFQLAQANPSPFGLTIDKTTLAEAKSKFNMQHAGSAPCKQCEVYKVDVKNINFSGIDELNVIAQDNIVKSVVVTLSKGKFDELYEQLGSKYELESKDIPFVGDKSASFKDDQTKIFLSAPHLSFLMTMVYVDENLFKSLRDSYDKNETMQKTHEEAML